MDIIVVESIKELATLTDGKYSLDDLHRPFMDDVVIQKDGKTYRRVEEVLDCWFESGSMPIAQQHYPFANKKEFDASFPADYIGEGLDQTRLWFYVLHVISSIIFERPAYKNVLVNGMVMAADGQKLSKRLKNYPPIDEVFSTEGADALRYYLLSSTPAVTADYMRFDRDALKDINRNLFMTLYNSASFLSLYAEIDNWKPHSINNEYTNLGVICTSNSNEIPSEPIGLILATHVKIFDANFNDLFQNEAIIIIDDVRLFGKISPEDFTLITIENIRNILNKRTTLEYFLNSELAQNDRMVVHLSKLP